MPADYDIAAALERIENELIDSMMRNLKLHLKEEEKMGFDWSQWQVEQLKLLEEYRKRNLKKYGPQFRSINSRIKHAILHGKTYGQKEEELRILEALSKNPELKKIFKRTGNAAIQGGSFFKINENKLDALIKATMNDMTKAEHAVLRRCDDQYRKIIFDSQMYANTGAGTVEKAVDMATHDFLKRGIDCIEYANGARHTISDYADMAIRTAERRAYLMGAGEKRKEWGISLVIVNRRGNMNGNYGTACPLCIPWLGKILIDDVYSGGRPDGKHELVSTAIQKGFLHPRCRDSFTTYFPGVTSIPDPVSREELKAGAEAEKQEAYEQYAERMAESFGRLAKYDLDPENKRKYEAYEEKWEGIRNARFRTGDMSSKEYAESKRPLAKFRATPADRAVPLLRKDFRTWIKELADEEIKAIKKYTKNSIDSKGSELFRRINAMLRGDIPATRELEKYANNISSAIRKEKGLKRDIICYRGTDKPIYTEKEVGDIFKDPQFISTSVRKRGAFESPFHITIYAKKGTRAAYIEELSSYPTQRELLLDKNTIFRVISKTEKSLELEVIA